MSEVKTNWAKATTDVNIAMASLMTCINFGYNAWLEIRENGDQEYPILKDNPLLENPFNWKSYVGVPRNLKEDSNDRAVTNFEKMMEDNYVEVFGEESAIKLYQETGILSEGLINYMGIAHPMKISDANMCRKLYTKDNYQYGFWKNLWKPKDGIKRKIVDDSIGKVIVVCFKNEPCDKSELFEKAADFLKNMQNHLFFK